MTSIPMAMLSAIRDSKKQLRSTVTEVTTAGGQRLRETHGDDGETMVEVVGRNGLGYVADLKPDLQVAVILDNVLLGSQDVASDLDLLLRHGVTHILNVGPVVHTVVASDPRFVCMHHEIFDLPEVDLTVHLQTCFQFIDAARTSGGRVLVHCNAGVSRSASILIGYLMKAVGLSFTDAHDRVKANRSCIRPNDGFRKTLQNFKPDSFR